MLNLSNNEDEIQHLDSVNIRVDSLPLDITLSDDDDNTLNIKNTTTSNSSPQNHSSNKKIEKILKNRECARQSRLRKRETIDKLFKENAQLKKEVSFLKSKLKENICIQCKNKLENKTGETNKNHLVQNNIASPLKKIVLFTTFTTILCLVINCLYRYSSIKSYNNTESENLRKLNRTNQFIINDIDKTKYKLASIFISYEDFLFLSTGKKYMKEDDSSKYSEQIRILRNEEIGNIPIEDCTNCMVEFNKTQLIKKKKNNIKFKIKIDNTNRFLFEDNC